MLPHTHFGQALERFLGDAPPSPPFIAPLLLTEAEAALLPPEAQLERIRTYELCKAQYDRDVNWYYDFIPRRGSHDESYSDEKLYDIETTQNRELEWSAAALDETHPQPIWFKRGMDAHFKPRSFALLFYLRQHEDKQCYRFIFACNLVDETADEREELLDRPQASGDHAVENFLVNHPDQPVTLPHPTTIQFFATQMGSDYQERLLLEYMDWRRREQENTTHRISTARIVSRKRTSKRTDWYVHLPVPLPVPSSTAALDAVIGFHEYEGMFFYAVVDRAGNLLALGEVTIPDHVKPKTADGMTNDNFAFETAVHIVRRSMTRKYGHRLRDTPVPYTASIGIEDTGWKQERVDTRTADNRQKVSLPRQRMYEIVAYKAVREGLPVPMHIAGIAPGRDCGSCGKRLETTNGIALRAVTHCLYCTSLGIEHQLITVQTSDDHEYMYCRACGRQWQREEPQFLCTHCRTQQYARYNTALATVHRTVDMLVGRQRWVEDAQEMEE